MENFFVTFGTIFLASIIAFSIVILVTVYLGSIIGKVIKPIYGRYATAAVFIIVGLLIFFKKI